MPKVKTNADLDGVGGGRQRRSRVVAAGRLRPGGIVVPTTVAQSRCVIRQSRQLTDGGSDFTGWEGGERCEQTSTCHRYIEQ